MKEIDVQTLHGWRERGQRHVLLDVREPDEVAIAAIPGSLNIPMGDVQAHMAELPRDEEIVVMCHHGGRSARVATFLAQVGFENVVNLEGGIDAWAVHVDRAMMRY